MNNICSLVIILQLFSSLNTFSQAGDVETNYKRLYRGDYLPNNDFVFKEVDNYPTKTLKWNDLKGKKLIILDFWTKYCSSCIASFPKMEALQKTFNDEIQIITITKNNRQELEYLLQRSENLRNLKLPSIINDQLFTKVLFPHNGVPYHVWIGQDNKVIATTSGTETNEASIRQFLSGKQPALLNRVDNIDQRYPNELDNTSKSLLEIEGGNQLKNIIFYAQSPILKNPDSIVQTPNISVQTGFPKFKYYSTLLLADPSYRIGMAGIMSLLTNEYGKQVGIRLFNTPLEYMIVKYAYSAEYQKLKPAVNSFNDRLYIDSSARKYYLTPSSSGNVEKVRSQNTYSYESFVENFTLEKANEQLKEVLALCLGIKAKIATQNFTQITFYTTDSTKWNKLLTNDKDIELEPDFQISKGNIQFKDTPWELVPEIFQQLNYMRGNSISFIDSTEITKRRNTDRRFVNLMLPDPSFILDDIGIDKLRIALEKYGIGVRKEISAAEFLTIYSDNNTQN